MNMNITYLLAQCKHLRPWHWRRSFEVARAGLVTW